MGVQFFVQDEVRIGLITSLGRKITCAGVKPVGRYLHKFKFKYIFGGFNVNTGDSVFLEADSANTRFFEEFLRIVSNEDPLVLKVIILDNAAYHKSKSLKIPHNVMLYFLPPYSPELNPSERAWQELRRKFKGIVYKEIVKLLDDVSQFLASWNRNLIRQTVGFPIYKKLTATVQNYVNVF